MGKMVSPYISTEVWVGHPITDGLQNASGSLAMLPVEDLYTP